VSTNQPAVRLIGLSHGYHDAGHHQSLFENVSLDVTTGETVALIGRSGCGKSSLLNLIGGLEPLQSGDIQLFGQSLHALNDHQRTLLRRQQIGFIYQAFNLIPTLSVEENVALPLALRTSSNAKQLASTAKNMLNAVGLADRADAFPDRLSGGEQQRVAIARALIHKPPLVLADEPTGNLDANSGRLVLELLTQLAEQQGTTLIIVTHSREVTDVATRTLTLHDGCLVPTDSSNSDTHHAW